MKHKLLSLVLCLALVLSLFAGCGLNKTNNPKETTTSPPIESTLSDEEKLVIQEEFNGFLNMYFEKLVTDGTFTFRLRLSNPDSFGIEAPDVCIDSFSDTYFTDYITETTDLMAQLSAFNYDGLTPDQQLTYDILTELFKCDMLLCKNYIYYEPLSSMSGIQTQLPILFSELPIESEEAIIECIALLNTIPDYFKVIIDFENEKGAAGCFMSEHAYDEVISQCNTLATSEGFSFLYTHFENIVNSIESLSDEQKSSYITELKAAVSDNFIEGYTYLVDELSIISTQYGHNEAGLSLNEQSIDYYEALVEVYTGSGKTIEELITLTEDAIDSDIYNMQVITLSDPDILSKADDYTMPYEEDPKAALNYLLEQIEGVFPAAPVTSFTLEEVDKALEDMLSPAFYLIPAIDNIDKNYIYINNNPEYDHMDLFPTLAHEGFPGHLYQTTYFASTNPHPVRQLLGLGGYMEGWAKYVEIYSYNFCNLDENVADLLAIDQTFSFGLYSRIDMGVHYEGWDLQDVRKYLSAYGFTDSELISDIYYTVLDNPGIYLQYYIGYLEICELRDYAYKMLGDKFSLLSFHKFILDMGPCQFYIIKDKLDVWIEQQSML